MSHLFKSITLPKTEDIKKLLYLEGLHSHFRTSGHKLPQQGEEYVELRNVTFICNKNYIIDAPEYDNLKDGSWYEANYAPLISWQLDKAVKKLTDDTDSRQAVLQFYDPDMMLDRQDMICTMYVSLRLDKEPKNNTLFMTYAVHMRSSDIREFRSDLKWHTKVMLEIAKRLTDVTGAAVWSKPIIWYADSLQCWDKDWEFLKKKEE